VLGQHPLTERATQHPRRCMGRHGLARMAACTALLAAVWASAAGAPTSPGPAPHVCGDGTVQAPYETCDDGNTVDENTVDPLPPDSCPSNCRIEPCATPSGLLTVHVDFASPHGVAGYKLFIDYPGAKVEIRGRGQPPVGVITDDPTRSAVCERSRLRNHRGRGGRVGDPATASVLDPVRSVWSRGRRGHRVQVRRQGGERSEREGRPDDLFGDDPMIRAGVEREWQPDFRDGR
jgi:cysteine-rich repeat protein